MLTSRRRFIASGAAAAVAAGAPRALRAAPVPLSVGYFPGVSALPLILAQRRGMFAREGLEVEATPVTGSVDLFTGLDTGRFAIGHTAFDNPVAYDTGSGDPRVAARDFCAFFGVDNGMLRIVARPGVRKILDLQGATLGVDAFNTGFTYALRAIFEALGMGIAGGPNDVKLVLAGGTQQRAQGLMARRFDATLLYPPFDLAAQAAGFSLLPRVTDVIGNYQGIVGVARRSWIAAHRDTAVAYVRAYRAALGDVLRDRAGAVVAIADMLAVSPAIAAASYDAAFGADGGAARDLMIDGAGARAVIRLRAHFVPPGPGENLAPFVDASVMNALG